MIYDCIDNASRNTNRLLDSLNDVGQTVQDNLNELNGVNEQPQAAAPAAEPQAAFDNTGAFDTQPMDDNGGQM